MSNTTYATHEIQARVKSLLDTADSEIIQSFFGSETPEISKYSSIEELEFIQAAKESNIKFSLMDSHGGEGEGDQYWSVYSFSTNGQTVYVKFNGWYASYNGSTFDEWFFVEPKKVEVIRYDSSLKFEWYQPSTGEWCGIGMPSFDPRFKYRVKPKEQKMLSIVGSDGVSRSYPEPVKDELDYNIEYYYPNIHSNKLVVSSFCIIDGLRNFEKLMLKRGLAHLTEDAAVLHAKAMLGID